MALAGRRLDAVHILEVGDDLLGLQQSQAGNLVPKLLR